MRRIKTCSHQAKANVKAKKMKEQSEEIKKKIQTRSRSLSLGVDRPLDVCQAPKQYEHLNVVFIKWINCFLKNTRIIIHHLKTTILSGKATLL